jgi:hypothetical protein
MKKIILLVMIVFISIACYGEINYSHQFSVPVDMGNNCSHKFWLADGNGDDQDELYVFSKENNYPVIRSLAEYDLNGNLLSVYSEPFPENIWDVWMSMYESDDSVYYLEVNQRSTEPSIYCDIKVYDYTSMAIIDSLSIEIGYGTGMSGDLFFVKNINVAEIDGSEYLYLGIEKYNSFGWHEKRSIDITAFVSA